MVLVYAKNVTIHVTAAPNKSYWYLKIILLDKFVLNIAQISIHFNSNYLRCFCVDVCLQNENKENKIKSQF
jgi:hypothetical protein